MDTRKNSRNRRAEDREEGCTYRVEFMHSFLISLDERGDRGQLKCDRIHVGGSTHRREKSRRGRKYCTLPDPAVEATRLREVEGKPRAGDCTWWFLSGGGSVEREMNCSESFPRYGKRRQRRGAASPSKGPRFLCRVNFNKKNYFLDLFMFTWKMMMSRKYEGVQESPIHLICHCSALAGSELKHLAVRLDSKDATTLPLTRLLDFVKYNWMVERMKGKRWAAHYGLRLECGFHPQ